MENPLDLKTTKALLKTRMDSEIITQTLDTLNSRSSGKSGKKSFSAAQEGMSQTYDFSKSVLSAAYEGKGIAVTVKG
ncbi:MAG: hypothetical protein LBP61_10185 [Desulfovibrio sp.]|jgi:hypothetical protein|nr:hypothetical protein [Desulfovibrio sp.]